MRRLIAQFMRLALVLMLAIPVGCGRGNQPPNPAAKEPAAMPQSTSTRNVLKDVPRVGFFPDMRPIEPDRGPEDIIFPSCMRAVMQYLGHPEYDYVHFVGVTGAGAFLNWKDGWHGDNGAIYYMVPMDECMQIFDAAYASAGYQFDFRELKGDDAIDEAEAKRLIIQQVDAGLPVLAHGVVGPPETCIITGYDEGGDVLIGWSFFQGFPDEAEGIELEPNGMFRKHDWFEQTWDIHLIGERGALPDENAMRRQSLRWMVKVARTPETWGGRHNGLAAYDAWAKHVLRDQDITPDGTVPEGSPGQPFGVHDDAVGHVAEARHFGAVYLRRIAEDEPAMRERLLKAAECYAREHDIMWKVWACVGGNGRSPEHIKRFADPEARRKIADLIREAREEDEMAVKHIEAALKAAGGT